MLRLALLPCLLLAGPSAMSAAVPQPPGLLPWGAPADVGQIGLAQRQGTVAEVALAITAAKQNRGEWLGCPDTVQTYTPATAIEPTAAALASSWTTIHAPGLATTPSDRPIPARGWGYKVLGAYAARRSGLAVDEAQIDRLIAAAEATQYADANAAWPPQRTAGMYGYVIVPTSDPWFDTTPVSGSTLGQVLLDLANQRPQVITAFDGGLWAGRTFSIADVDASSGWYDGGAAYDHGIAGAAMIEGAMQHPDASVRARRLASARLATDWAIAEPPVVNANYTAKLVWLLASMYALGGAPADRTALLDKLDRAVLPGILMDANADGVVDGVAGRQFADLAAVAQTPGRLWDGHNSRTVYHAMIAQAVTAAYAALRDRGDLSEAARIKPYALALLGNLAAEINGLGVPASGRGLVPFALIQGQWLIDRAEGTSTPAWNQALARLWTAGSFNQAGESSGALGLMTLKTSAVPYQTQAQRWQSVSVGSGGGVGVTAGTGGGGCGSGGSLALLAVMVGLALQGIRSADKR